MITNYELTDSITGEISHWVTIENADGGFTSMSKAHYDEQQAQAALSTPSLPE